MKPNYPRLFAFLALEIFVLAFSSASCNQAAIPSPAVPGYPCGVMGIVCDTNKCCDRNESCGIPNTSSAGMCVDDGGDENDPGGLPNEAKRQKSGLKRMRPQWSPNTPRP